MGSTAVALLGGSCGGSHCLTFALFQPNRVAGLILVDTAARYCMWAESLAVAQRRGTPAMLAALNDLWEDGLADDDAFRAAWRAILPLYFHRLGGGEITRLADRSSYSLASRRRILPTLRHYDLRDRLNEIRAPALVIAGQHDWLTAVSQARELAGGLPHARLAVFEQSGHYPFIEETERFLATARRWLGEEPHVTGTRAVNE